MNIDDDAFVIIVIVSVKIEIYKCHFNFIVLNRILHSRSKISFSFINTEIIATEETTGFTCFALEIIRFANYRFVHSTIFLLDLSVNFDKSQKHMVTYTCLLLRRVSSENETQIKSRSETKQNLRLLFKIQCYKNSGRCTIDLYIRVTIVLDLSSNAY